MTDLGSIYGTTVDGSNTLVIDFSNVDICGNLKTNNIIGNGIQIDTNQIYPKTDNSTMLGGSGNRWSTGYFQNLITNEIDGGVSHISIKLNDSSQGGRLRFNTSSTQYFVMRADEFSFYNGNSAAGMYLNWNGADVYLHGGTLVTSDDRIKFNETNITNGLEIIRKLSPERYTKKLPNQTTGTEEAGFIAQEVLQIPDLKFAVKHSEKEIIEGDPNTRYYTLTYDSIFTYAVAGLKELDTIVQNQQTEITELKNALNTLLSEAGKPTI